MDTKVHRYSSPIVSPLNLLFPSEDWINCGLDSTVCMENNLCISRPPQFKRTRCKTNAEHYFCFSPFFLKAKILSRCLSVRENRYEGKSFLEGRSFIKGKWHKANFQKARETFILIRKNWKVPRLEKQINSYQIRYDSKEGLERREYVSAFLTEKTSVLSSCLLCYRASKKKPHCWDTRIYT